MLWTINETKSTYFAKSEVGVDTFSAREDTVCNSCEITGRTDSCLHKSQEYFDMTTLWESLQTYANTQQTCESPHSHFMWQNEMLQYEMNESERINEMINSVVSESDEDSLAYYKMLWCQQAKREWAKRHHSAFWDDISSVKNQTPIADFIISTCWINKKPIYINGKVDKICCPLHKENTPSLKIYHKTNSWYCFGCHEWGDHIDLLEKFFNISKWEAIKKFLWK